MSSVWLGSKHLGQVAGKPWITVGNGATKLGSLNSVGMLESQVAGQVVALNFQRQNVHGYHNGQWIQSNKQNGFTHRDRWFWLTDHGVPRTKIGTLLECYPICISRKAQGLITRTRS